MVREDAGAPERAELANNVSVKALLCRSGSYAANPVELRFRFAVTGSLG